jgi:hypothetical protein
LLRVPYWTSKLAWEAPSRSWYTSCLELETAQTLSEAKDVPTDQMSTRSGSVRSVATDPVARSIFFRTPWLKFVGLWWAT